MNPCCAKTKEDLLKDVNKKIVQLKLKLRNQGEKYYASSVGLRQLDIWMDEIFGIIPIKSEVKNDLENT